VWLKVRRAFGPQRVLLLVAYGVRTDGRRQLLAFVRAKSESQAGWGCLCWQGLAISEGTGGSQRSFGLGKAKKLDIDLAGGFVYLLEVIRRH